MSVSESAQFFELFGRLLYGEQWRNPLADAIGVQYNTLGKWISEKRGFPPDVFAKLYRLCLERERAITQAIVTMDRHCRAQGINYREAGR